MPINLQFTKMHFCNHDDGSSYDLLRNSTAATAFWLCKFSNPIFLFNERDIIMCILVVIFWFSFLLLFHCSPKRMLCSLLFLTIIWFCFTKSVESSIWLPNLVQAVLSWAIGHLRMEIRRFYKNFRAKSKYVLYLGDFSASF